LALLFALLALLLVLTAGRVREGEAKAAYADRCGALTLKGTPCRNLPKPGYARCWRHRPLLTPRPVALPI
jgi:hypothetical protein